MPKLSIPPADTSGAFQMAPEGNFDLVTNCRIEKVLDEAAVSRMVEKLKIFVQL